MCNLKHSVLDMFVSMAISSSLSEIEDGSRIAVNNGVFNARRLNSFNLMRNVYKRDASLLECFAVNDEVFNGFFSFVAAWT